MRRMRKWYWLALLAALLLAWVWGNQHLAKLLPQAKQDAKQDKWQAQQLACHHVLNDCGDASTLIRFSHIPSKMQPFQVTLQHTGAQQIYLDFVMPGMRMGLNRYRMLPQGNAEPMQNSQTQHWQAQVILPACVQGRSDWQMWISIEYAHGKASKTQWIAFSAGSASATE